MSKLARRLVLALAFALIAAFAAPVGATASPIDPGRVGSLTIHKYLVPEGSSINAGRPAQGVTFTLARVVDVDLTTEAGWQRAAQLAAGSGVPGVLGGATSTVTDASGSAVFADLELGLYRVTETTAPAGVDPIDPFFVTVPLTDPEDGDRWLYDVHVYPKNVAPDLGDPTDPGPTDPGDGEEPDPAPGAGAEPSGPKPFRPGITGAETGMLTAIAFGLFAAGAWLVVIVGRLRRRREAASDG